MRRSIRIGRAPCLLRPDLLNELPGTCYCLKRTSRSAVFGDSGLVAFACSSRWIRPCFSSRRGSIPQLGFDLVPACPSSPPLGFLPLGFKDHAFNAPTQQRPDRFDGPVFGPIGALILRPGLSLSEGQTSPRPRPEPAWRSGQFRSPFGSDRRDPNSLAPNRSKARTTPLRPSRISASS